MRCGLISKIILSIMALNLMGCESISYRSDPDYWKGSSTGPYPAIQKEVQFTKDAIHRNTSELEDADSFMLWFLIPDLPLAFVVDTIFFPYDVFKGLCKGKDKKSSQNTEPVKK